MTSKDRGYQFTMVTVNQIISAESSQRTRIDENQLEELKNSINNCGLLQPIGVVALPEDRYRLVFGHRRLLACKALEKADIPAIVLEGKDLDVCALLENLQREDLNTPDMALAIKRIVEKSDLNQHDLAQFLGKSKSWVSKMNRLGELVEEYGGKTNIVSFTKLSLSTYLELLDSPELLIMAEDGRWTQNRAREMAEMKKSRSDDSSQNGDVLSNKPVANALINRSRKQLEKYEPIEINNNGFKINGFKYDKSFGYDTELLLEKIEELQNRLELVISVLRKNLGRYPEPRTPDSCEINRLDQITFEF